MTSSATVSTRKSQVMILKRSRARVFSFFRKNKIKTFYVSFLQSSSVPRLRLATRRQLQWVAFVSFSTRYLDVPPYESPRRMAQKKKKNEIETRRSAAFLVTPWYGE